MFTLPDSAPWWAVMPVVVLGIVVFGVRGIVRAVWPQASADRRELLQGWQRQRERKAKRTRQRRELGRRE